MTAKRNVFLVCAGLVVIVFMVYWPTIGHQFVNYDDFDYVVKNSHVKGGITLEGIRWAFTSTHASNWHPVTWLSHMLDVQLFGLNAGGHHLMNILFHAANTVSLFLLLRMMTGALWRSAIVASLFAAHPLHVESVAWVAERKDLLSTFFFLLTVRVYSSYVKSPGRKRYFPVLFLFAVGLMAKPMLVTLPFVLLLLDFWPLNRLDEKEVRREKAAVFKRLLIEKIPFLFLSACSSVMTIIAQQSAIWNLAEIPFADRLGNAAISYVKYIGMTLWPAGLAVFYPYPDAVSLPAVLSALLILIIISAGAIVAAGKFPYVPVGWFWFLGTLFPVIGIVQVGSQAMADRYTYIPLTGIFIILVWGGNEIIQRFRLNARVTELAAAAVIAILMVLSHIQVLHWKDSITLFQHAVMVTSRNHVAHNNLGIAFAQAGKINEASAHFREAVRISPGYADARHNLALHCQGEGNIDEAIVHYRELLRIRPGPDARNNLAVALMAKGELDEAAGHLLKAIREEPGNARAHNNYGVLLLRKGDPGAAISHFETALRLDPAYLNARGNLELAIRSIKDTQKRGFESPFFLQVR